jgi:drug/metabolite transporter (DMT)-like permease
MKKEQIVGQETLEIKSLILMIFVVIVWSSNSVVVKMAVKDIPPFWAAFLRFSPTLPFVYLFIRRFGSGIRITRSELFRISILGLMMFFQIYLFNLGSQFTTGGRVTLIIFSFPLFVSIIAPFFIKDEYLTRAKILGCTVSVLGLILALQRNMFGEISSTFKGDSIELISCLILAVTVVYNKRLCMTIDKWKVLFWEFVIASTLFFLAAIFTEELIVNSIGFESWAAVAYQSIGVSIFCFLSWQYILAKHNSTDTSVFFFAGPLIGMTIGIILLGEAFDPWLLLGCVLVGAGIYLVNRH